METFFDLKEVTVIDNGSGYIKVGYSGEDLPRVSLYNSKSVTPTVMSEKITYVEQTAATEANEERCKVYLLKWRKTMELTL